MSAAEETVLDDQRSSRRGLKPGQRHSGSFGPGFDPRRRGYYYEGKSFAQMAAEHAPDCLRLWVRVIKDEDAPWPIRIRASELIVERAYGKAASVVDMQVTHNRPLNAMTDEELLRIIDAEPVPEALASDGDQGADLDHPLAVRLAVTSENAEESP